MATNPGNPHEHWLRGLATFKTKMAKWSKKVGFYKKFYLSNLFKITKTQIKVANDQKPKYKSDHKKYKKRRGHVPSAIIFYQNHPLY